MKHLFLVAYTIVALMLSGTNFIFGQNYNLNEKPLLDPKIKSGVLDNGMHYYIFSNKLPEKRADFYIANNVGAIQEDDDQNGLAHFTEHMSFNGTKHFPKKGFLNYMETIGLKFGQNINAMTGIESTIYQLTNVPLLREGITDTALLVLFDLAHNVLFEPEEIELERGVILEEWRMYGTAKERMKNKLLPVIFKDSKYATRNIIGDTTVILHSKRETFLRFYNTWYRPDLQAIVVVGDFDVNMMEAKIKKLFSTLPKMVNPVTKEEFQVPDNKEPIIGTATDKEATATQIEINFKHNPVKDSEKNLGYMRLQFIRSFINQMLSQRLNEIARKENSPFISAYTNYGGFTRTKDAFTGQAQSANNESVKALTALLTEMERMKQFGFTAGEFERAKQNILRSYESDFKERDRKKNSSLVFPMIRNFLTNEPDPGIEYKYQFASSVIPGITLEEINKEANGFVTDENMIIMITGPDKQGVTLPSREEIQKVISSYKINKISPYVDNIAGKKLIEKDPVPGKVEIVTVNKELGTTEWKLSNGIKVILKPTDFKEDEVLINGSSPGGWSLLKEDDLPASKLLGNAVSQMGIGNFSSTDLTKMMAGKIVYTNLGLSEEQENISASASPKDLETSLQLIYLYFTQPRWDESDFKSWMEKMKSRYINADAEPRKIFNDTLTVMLADHNPRVVPMSYKLLDKITFQKLQEIYKQRFSDPGSFTFQFVGKINPNEARPLIEKYLASLPDKNQNETFKDNGIRWPKGHVKNDFKHESKALRTTISIDYKGTCNYTAEEWLYISTIKRILELRYTESIREDQGGAYSISVYFGTNKYPIPSYDLEIHFETDPAKADKLIEIVYKEIKNLIDNGPSEADVQKAKEYFVKQRQEDLKENRWWNMTLNNYYTYHVDFITGYENNVKALDTKTIHEYAKKILSQGDIIEIIMRP